MWDRKQLKSRAKFSFKRNYWKCVLVSLLFALVVGGSAGGSAASQQMGQDKNAQQIEREEYMYSELYEFDDEGNLIQKDSDGNSVFGEVPGTPNLNELEEQMSGVALTAFLVTFFTVFLVVFCIILAIAIVLDVFVCIPVEVGCDRFFFKNLGENEQVKEVMFAFDHNYKNIVKVMFFRDLYTVLWTLLFIIPGIVKSYEYQMIPYLLAENPQMTKEQAFAESKRMMTGQKWRAFVLDLSFLGWKILSLFTLGILDIFYVQPYMDSAHAALYDALRYYGAPMGEQS